MEDSQCRVCLLVHVSLDQVSHQWQHCYHQFEQRYSVTVHLVIVLLNKRQECMKTSYDALIVA
jgi:hypothetical protein